MPRTYRLDHAAALLNMGRNTLAHRLRAAGVLGRDNLPAGPYRNKRRGATRLMIVVTGTYHPPTCGWTHYGRTEFTDAGLDCIAQTLGIHIATLPAPTARQPTPPPQQRKEPIMADAADIAGDITERRLEEALTQRRRSVSGDIAPHLPIDCEECGDAIPAARRRAAPWARTCVACQTIRERQARGHR